MQSIFNIKKIKLRLLLIISFFWRVKLTTTNFSFEGLMIERLIVHRIYAKNADKSLNDPKISNNLNYLDLNTKNTLESRLTKALGNKSHGIEVTITETAENSFFDIASKSMYDSDEDFIKKSAILAQNLTKAQSTTNAPDGVLLIVQGRVGGDPKRFIAVIKAEHQDGFASSDNDDYISINYISDLLLTPASRLFKIGFLVEEINRSQKEIHFSNYRAFLFDHLMSSVEASKAAIYFYQNFLGMSIAESSKKLTQDFFNFTRKFIDSSGMTDDEKLDTHEALRVTLKNTDKTLSVNEFSQKFLPTQLQIEYENFMRNKNFPSNSFVKDVEYIKMKFKTRRKYCFNNNVIISTPSNKTEDYLSFRTSEDELHTLVTIKGILQRQE